jgi:hypothetical protein
MNKLMQLRLINEFLIPTAARNAKKEKRKKEKPSEQEHGRKI